MFATVKSCILVGISAEFVEVECTIARGQPQYSAVGLVAPSVKEGATPVQSVRTVADLMGQDDLDAGGLLEAAAFRNAGPTDGRTSQVA